MKYFIIVFFVISNSLFSQEISAEEYKIYVQVLDRLSFNSNQFYLGLSTKEKKILLVERNPIEIKIGKLKSKKTFDLSRLDSYILKFRKDKSLDRENYIDILKDSKIKVTCSNIYFKNETEAYIYGIAEFRTMPKRMEFLYKATKEPDGYWCLENYTFYF